VNAQGKPDVSNLIRCQCKEVEDRANRDALLMEMCELPAKAKNMTMDNFEVTDRNREAYEWAKKLIDGELVWLIMADVTGTGKTHLALAVCQEWLKQKKPAKYTYVPRLLDELKAGMNDHTLEYRFKLYCTVPLLIMDDLGLERSSEWVTDRLTTLINERLMNELPLIVTTNKSLGQLPGDDEGRISSRLTRESFCHAVVME
jgi:DNA replication protein DnaC